MFDSMRFTFVAVLLAFSSSAALAQLRIVDYNTAGVNNPSALSTIFQAIEDESINATTKPLDVLILQEQNAVASDTQAIVNILNGIYGAGTYARSTFDSQTSGAGRPALIYNTQTVQLIAETGVTVPVNTSAAARQPVRYQLRPVGYDSSADFYIFNSHYKAGDTTTDRARRNVEALAIRANADLLGNAHIIYAGDFNIYSSSESMWTTLTAPGNGQAFDPVNQVGSWSDNAAFIAVHTQSPVSNATPVHFSGQVRGGMDDRFDWQTITGELQDDEGMSILAGSYHAFGNNGTHSLNSDINVVANTAQPIAVLSALADASDHIPVVAQYQVPAKMALSASSVPSQVIVNASLSSTLNVSNSAGDGTLVTIAAGADELDYTITATGDASGAANGSDSAFGSTNDHNFALDTSTAGAKSATFTPSTTSPQVPTLPAAITRNYSVLDHANASFSSTLDLNTLTLDFGPFQVGSGTQQLGFDISNLLATAGFTAALDLLSFPGSGDTAVLTTNLSTFDNLAPANMLSYLASLDTSTIGDYNATYLLNLSDDTAILGATGQTLTLNLLGEVVIPEPATFSLVLLSLLGILAIRGGRPLASGARVGSQV